jgi:26S proteasome regulatory subunit N8
MAPSNASTTGAAVKAVVPSEALSSTPVSKVIVHPLVLLNVVDHYSRVSKVGAVKRVVGILLGSWQTKDVLDVSNSFAVPFDEDDKDPNVWFLDNDYLASMYTMFKKVNAKEKIVGWYHTGPKLHHNDILINDLVKKQSLSQNTVLVIVDVKLKQDVLPTQAYVEVEEVHDDGTPSAKTFEHVSSEIGAEEAEEVGVEHLLRDIKDVTVGTLSQRIANQLSGLEGLGEYLKDIHRYLKAVGKGELPVNHSLVNLLQDVLILLPNVTSPGYVKAANIETNDQLMTVYLGSLVRAVIALHNLINNKISLRQLEKKDTDKVVAKKEADKEKDKEKKPEEAKKDEKKP